MDIRMAPGTIRTWETWIGEAIFNGPALVKLDRELDDDVGENRLGRVLRALDELIPGAWHWYDRLPDERRREVLKLLNSICDLSRELVAGNIYPLIVLMEIYRQVMQHVKKEEEERLRE